MDGYFSTTTRDACTLLRNKTNAHDQVHQDAALDEALRCTFPASDPVALDFSVSAVVVEESVQPANEDGACLAGSRNAS
jgi:hypothetical protein